MSTTLFENAQPLHETEFESPDCAMERARSGAAWLDEQFGPAWDGRIDFAKLDIGSPIRCILGQLILHGYLSLIFATRVVDHGFSRGLLDVVALLVPFAPLKRAYRPLTNAWKTVLLERRGSTQPHIKPASRNDSHRRDTNQAA
jgi:hypothetical protein